MGSGIGVKLLLFVLGRIIRTLCSVSISFMCSWAHSLNRSPQSFLSLTKQSTQFIITKSSVSSTIKARYKKVGNLKNIFFFLGSIAGVYAFIRLVIQDSFSLFWKPKLTIVFTQTNDVNVWQVGPPYIPSMENRKVATIHIHNKGRKPALCCEAFAQIFNINGQVVRTLPLHWADTLYDARSTSIERVQISKLPRRLDVVFSQERQGGSGCSIASAQALAAGVQNDQFFLAQGEHKIRIHINYNSGNSVEQAFIVSSPSTWRGLTMQIA